MKPAEQSVRSKFLFESAQRIQKRSVDESNKVKIALAGELYSVCLKVCEGQFDPPHPPTLSLHIAQNLNPKPRPRVPTFTFTFGLILTRTLIRRWRSTTGATLPRRPRWS